MSTKGFGLSLVCLLIGSALASPAEADRQLPCGTPTVSTQSGPVCGLQVQSAGTTINSYLGIPFAQPPVVTDPNQCENETPSPACLRWKPPLPPSSWTDTLQATQFGAECPQFDQDKDLVGAEDCLYLNVWAPQGATGRPVMVWIHGGAFYLGTASTELFDGAKLAATGNVVVVDLNYRLGALGFLAAADANSANSLMGNYGFLDQQMALKWVQDNVASFGGDPAKVTIFGQSAGAMSVGLHLVAAPDSQGLFRAGVMESNPLGTLFQVPAAAEQTGKKLMQGLGCSDVGCLYTKDMEAILDQQKTLPGASGSTLTWGPIVDGTIVTKQPLTSFDQLQQPVVLGTNHDEGTYFVYLTDPYFPLPGKPASGGSCSDHPDNYQCLVEAMFGPTIGTSVLSQYPIVTGDNRPVLSQVMTDYLFTCSNRYAAEHVPAAQKAYIYQFNAVSGFKWPVTGYAPVCAKKVCHSAELPYVFDTPEALSKCGFWGNKPCSFNTGQGQLSAAVMGYWTSFASSLAPSGPTAWPAFDQYLLLDASQSAAQITTGADPFKSTCCFWENLGLYGPSSPGCQTRKKGKE